MRRVRIELELPKNWAGFRMPRALQSRLQALLDRQDKEEKLSRTERSEAKALVDLSDLLTLMKLNASGTTERRK